MVIVSLIHSFYIVLIVVRTKKERSWVITVIILSMQGDNLGSVTPDNFIVTISGQMCMNLSIILEQMQVEL
jgi:hypothetical protein